MPSRRVISSVRLTFFVESKFSSTSISGMLHPFLRSAKRPPMSSTFCSGSPVRLLVCVAAYGIDHKIGQVNDGQGSCSRWSRKQKSTFSANGLLAPLCPSDTVSSRPAISAQRDLRHSSKCGSTVSPRCGAAKRVPEKQESIKSRMCRAGIAFT